MDVSTFFWPLWKDPSFQLRFHRTHSHGSPRVPLAARRGVRGEKTFTRTGCRMASRCWDIMSNSPPTEPAPPKPGTVPWSLRKVLSSEARVVGDSQQAEWNPRHRANTENWEFCLPECRPLLCKETQLRCSKPAGVQARLDAADVLGSASCESGVCIHTFCS